MTSTMDETIINKRRMDTMDATLTDISQTLKNIKQCMRDNAKMTRDLLFGKYVTLQKSIEKEINRHNEDWKSSMKHIVAQIEKISKTENCTQYKSEIAQQKQVIMRLQLELKANKNKLSDHNVVIKDYENKMKKILSSSKA